MYSYQVVQKKTLIAITLIALLGVACHTPNSSIVDTPNPSSECYTDGDCVLAIRVDVCCSCPEVTTKARIRDTEGIEIYIPGSEYGSLRPMWCIWATCRSCSSLTGVVCKSGECRAPESVQEILAVCPDCYIQAAQAAYQAGGFKKAIEFCTQSASEEQFVCFSRLFSTALDTNRLGEAETLCRQYLDQDVGSCLRSLAQKWANSDDQRSIALCNEIDPADARHFSCLLDVALAVEPQNRERALEICEQLPSEEAELCRQEITRE
jgi:hypothetical protein